MMGRIGKARAASVLRSLRWFFEGKGLGCMVMQLGFWDCTMRLEDDGLRMGA